MNIDTIIAVVSKAKQEKEDKWFVFHYGPQNKKEIVQPHDIDFYNDEVIITNKEGESLYISADAIHTMFESKNYKNTLFAKELINENKTYKITEE